MSNAVDLLEQLQAQFATDCDALTLSLDRLQGEEKRLRNEVLGLSGQLNETLRSARVYAEECRIKAHEAKTSEIAMRARLVCAQDLLRQTAHDLKELSDGLALPEEVLLKEDLAYRRLNGNPFERIVQARSALYGKSKALTKFAGGTRD